MIKYQIIGLLLCNALIAVAQNVGINTQNPEEQIHVRTDSTRLAMRMDSKKSVQGGVNYFTAIGLPSNVFNSVLTPAYFDWTDLDATKLQSSDNIRLNSPMVGILPDVCNLLRVKFTFNSNIPTNATITNVALNAEWKRNGNNAGEMRISLIQLANDVTNAVLINYENFVQITSSSDVTEVFQPVQYYNPITPDMFNFDDVEARLWNLHSVTPGQSRLEIDRIWLEVEYTLPADGTENSIWSQGVQEGDFTIAKSGDLGLNQYLRIKENGITQIRSLQITENAGAGKVLTSDNNGKASWANYPNSNSESIWIDKQDTAYYAYGPIQANNSIGDAAFIFDKGESRLNNSINMIETDNRLLNVILDANDDQVNEVISFYRDSTQAFDEDAAVRFHLDNGDSWINCDRVGIGTSNPQADLEVRFENDPSSNGLKLTNSIIGSNWRIFTGTAGNLGIFNSINLNVGSWDGISGAYTSISDRRLKKNIEPFSSTLHKVLQLKSYTYHFNSQSDNEKKTLGVLAQEVENIFPEAVFYDRDADSYKVDYSVFGVIALQAIKEQQEIIEAQNIKIEGLIKLVESSLNKE